jgi:hypothetical protein
MILSGSVCALIASPHILSVLSLACMNTCERKFSLIFNFSVYLMGFIFVATGKVVHPAAPPAPAASPSHLHRCRLSPNSLQSSGAGPTHPSSGKPPHKGVMRRGLRPPTSARSTGVCSLAMWCWRMPPKHLSQHLQAFPLHMRVQQGPHCWLQAHPPIPEEVGMDE